MIVQSARGVQPCPPSSNTGGKLLPPSVSIDWLSFSWEFDKLPVKDMAGMLSMWFGSRVELEVKGRGWMGFKSRADILISVEGQTMAVGLMAWGGGSQNGRALVSIPGKGCALIEKHRWPIVQEGLTAIEARITRVDLAADDMDGVFPVDQAVAWYRAGDFITGGNPPSYKCEGDWLNLSGAGRTFYVGKATNGKMLRVYEKGKQLGDVESPWVRWELQLGNKDRVIPYDVITRTAHYFSGGYSCLARVVEAAAERVKTCKAHIEKSLARLITYARSSYGRLVHVMLADRGGDYVSVLDSLLLPGVPSSLSQAWIAMRAVRAEASANSS